ncbi:MAG TPA: XRE family transcriptional regulator [Candidatus Methylacidiphilales bacterium]|nr:XRE family transcriptional regulator [Candidatus Methylacidiphilales bacterium]
MTTPPQRPSFAERLGRARKMRELSFDDLSRKTEGISKSQLSKLEKGDLQPDSTILLTLCGALQLPPDYFFAHESIQLLGVEFRKRVKCPQKTIDRIQEESQHFFERYLEAEQILGILRPGLFQIDLREHSNDALDAAAEAAALTIRNAWQIGLGPVANIHETMEENGVMVKEVECDESFDGFAGRANGFPVIVIGKWLNKNELLPRKRFTLAHELGHLVLRLPTHLDKKRVETLCHRFAGAFIIPAQALDQLVSSGRHAFPPVSIFKDLKAEWGMSVHAIAHRLANLGIMTKSHLDSFNFLYRGKWQYHKKGDPGTWIGSEVSNRFRKLVWRAAAEELVTRSKAAQWLDMSVDEFNKSFEVIESCT